MIPAGNLKTRSNDTEYPFRAVHRVRAPDRRPDRRTASWSWSRAATAATTATVYLLPRSDRENGEFWLDGQGELWVGRRHSLAEAEQLLGLPARRRPRGSPTSCAEATGPVRVVRGYDAGIEAALADKVTAERDEELRVFLSRAAPGQGRVGDRRAAEGRATPPRAASRTSSRVLDQAEATSER